jgi:hypothetical protein
MEINAAFDKRVAIHAAHLDWAPSPMPGVHRRMLDRLGDEVARATSIVRFDPGSAFSPHTHGGGEEFIVLDGVFQDEHDDFPAGSYIRNPPTSSHTPASAPGCTILVKLWQMDPDDRSHVRIDTARIGAVADAARPGVSVTPLFKDAREDVRLETWAPGARVAVGDPGGAELFVLSGGFEEAGERFGPESWLRLPPGADSAAVPGSGGTKVWVKTGHLVHARAPAPA